MQQNAIRFRHLIGASQVNAAGFVLKSLQTAGPDSRFQLAMQQLEIISRRVVEDYEIDPQTFVMQVFMRAHELLDGAHVGGFVDADNDDR